MKTLQKSRVGRLLYESDITRYGPFVAGFLLAYFRVFYSSKLQAALKNKAVGFAVFLAALILILAPILTPLYNPGSWYYAIFSTKLNLWVLSISRQVFSLGVMLLILGCWYSDSKGFQQLNKIFSWSIWRPISKLSFPIYLFHFPFIAIAAIAVFGTTNVKEIVSVSFLSGSLIFLLAFALTFLFSIPLHIYIERPFAVFGKKKETRP